MLEIYKSIRNTMTEENYQIFKKEYLQENANKYLDYKLVREIAFSRNKEFTIRMEQMDESKVQVVKKSVWQGITHESCNDITKDECEKLLSGDTEWMNNQNRPIVHNLYLQIKYNKIKPKYIREYVEETITDSEDRKKVIFTYGKSSSKKKLESFFDINAKFERYDDSITVDNQVECSTPSFLLQLM